MLDKSVVSPVLVGRTDDLASLDQLLEQTSRGTGHIALISGEAGIGKSRLVAEIVQHAEKRSIRIFKGNCFETDRALPYAPFTDLLRVANRPSSDILRELASLLHALGSISPSLDSEINKRRLFYALAEFFAAQAQPSALIVIEDLHWCDETSLEFLLYLARGIDQQSLFLLCTYRSNEAPPALEHFLAELDRMHVVTELRLNRLAQKGMDSMLRAIFDLDRPVRNDFLKVLYRLTEGNPFFIEEILKSLIVAGDIYYANGVWDRKPIEELQIPRSVQDAVHRRAEKLSERARETLRYAAVAGRRFNFRLLRELTRMGEEELLKVVKELITAQLVVEESADVFAFRHALTREAAYSTMLIRERKQYHRMIAETIEQLYADSPESHLTDLAYHFYQAADWVNALKYSERAGRKAQSLYAPREAAEQFTHAVESAKRLAMPASPELLCARGEAYEILGDFENARADFIVSLERARTTLDRESEWIALIELGKLWTSRDYTKSGEYYQAALARAREIGDAAKIASSLNRIGNWNSNLDRPHEAIVAHQEALANFTRLGDPAGIAETSDLLAMANWIGGDLNQATICYTQAVKLFHEKNDRPGLVSSLATLALRSGKYKTETLVLPMQHLSEANADGEEALKIAREIDVRSGETYALWCLGASLASQGDYGRALTLTQEALAIADEIQHQQWLTAANCVLGGIYLDLLNVPDALIHLERAVALAKEIGSRHWSRISSAQLAMTCIAQKVFSRAEKILQEAIPPDTPMDSVGKRQCWLARAELALAQGDTEQALDLVKRLIASAYSSTDGQSNYREKIIPRLWKLRGDVLAAQHSADAERILREGINAAREQGALPLIWRFHISLGKLIANDEEFDTARRIVHQIATSVTASSVREIFVTSANALIPAARTLTARQIAKKEFGGLTLREREIAVMIAEGKSNREIADALVVSERTVETHVGNVLTKLGVRSRAQIAAWAVEKGLR